MSGAYNAATGAAVPKYTHQSVSTQKTTTQHGGTGVQFGAFSSMSAAQTHVDNIKNKLGVSAVVEATGTGLYRVRIYGLSEADAQKIKSSATAHGIDSYVFH